MWRFAILTSSNFSIVNIVMIFPHKIIVLQDNHLGFSGRSRVYRRRGERYSRSCIVEKEQCGGGSVMMWGGISLHTKTALVTVQGRLNARAYQNQIVRPHIVPHVRANRGMILAQDNAPCHVARTTAQLLRASNVRVLPWPARSPDLNPIEHIWDLIGRRARRNGVHNTVAQLEADLRQQWTTLGPVVLRNYIMSMRRRCQEVIRANGGHSSY